MNDAVAVDVLIVGGGPVGMTLALALAGSRRRVLMLDRAPRGAWKNDPRILAIAHGSRQMIERLGAWQPESASAIREIHVSQRGGFGRTLIAAADYKIPALGYVLRYGDLATTLAARLPESLTVAQGEVRAIEVEADTVSVLAEMGGVARTISAQLVVHAEGAPPTADDAAMRVHDYRQQAIVAEIEAALPHRGRAWERFTSEGPVALLPHENGYAMVFTAAPERAAALLALDDAAFLAVLHEQFGSRLDFAAIGPRTSIPLCLRVRGVVACRREAWIGNTAQTLHPVSGQGLNLGLRDAFGLAELLLQDDASDAGAPALLEAYARSRRLDRGLGVGITDGLVRLFSNDLPPLRVARGLGLLALDLYPPLRHFVARRMLWGARAWP